MKFHKLDNRTQTKTPFAYSYGKGIKGLRYRIIQQPTVNPLYLHKAKVEEFIAMLLKEKECY